MLRYAFPFLFLAALPLLDNPHSYRVLWIVPFIVAVLLLGGGGIENEPHLGDRWAHRLIPQLFVPALLGLMVWGMFQAVAPERGPGSFLALAAALGVVSGIFGLVASHEMIHSPSTGERFLGDALLAALSYRHFSISHIHGHHCFAATARDPGTARRGESAYRFLGRTIPEQWLFAWKFERRRLGGRSPAFNRCYQSIAICIGLYVSVLVLFGWRAAAMQALISIIAICLLEMFNYVAHYGMERGVDQAGRREPLAPHHSWNTKGLLANGLLLNMGRHSDHHRRAQSPYQLLEAAPLAPDLPGGYAGSILMALFPPLWRYHMDRRLAKMDAGVLVAFCPSIDVNISERAIQRHRSGGLGPRVSCRVTSRRN